MGVGVWENMGVGAVGGWVEMKREAGVGWEEGKGAERMGEGVERGKRKERGKGP